MNTWTLVSYADSNKFHVTPKQGGKEVRMVPVLQFDSLPYHKGTPRGFEQPMVENTKHLNLLT